MTDTAPGETGALAEGIAQAYLEARGLKLVERNFRISAWEIDLIMADGKLITFVEVRYRRQAGFGDGEETVGPRKRRRLVRAARAWLQRQRAPEPATRFDVVSLAGDLDDPAIRWTPDAFQVEEDQV